jgi:hypothetical protein
VLASVIKRLERQICDTPSADLCQVLHILLEDYQKVRKTGPSLTLVQELQVRLQAMEARVKALEATAARKEPREGARALVARMG